MRTNITTRRITLDERTERLTNKKRPSLTNSSRRHHR